MIRRQLFLRGLTSFRNMGVGLKHFAAQELNQNVQMTDRPKLRVMEKVPQFSPNLRPPKTQKKLIYMRGREEVHNTYLYKQYGIVAIEAGRLLSGHFEMLRLTIGREMDVQRMFAIWRVHAPWQPITKKGLGQRMGGGKGPIDHYVTPIKSGRVILEIGGKCEFSEVRPFLEIVCSQLPFKAVVLSHEDMKRTSNQKISPQYSSDLTMQFVIQNNLSGCHKWVTKSDHKFKGAHVISI